jgi:transposase, IS5 family
MLRLRYEPVDLFRLVHTLPELAGCSDLAMDPLLATIDHVLDDQKVLLFAWNDYVARRPHCLETGRDSTPVEALLRLQVLRRLYGWSYDQIRTQVQGSLALRQFTRLYGHRVPSKATLDDWALALHPATVRLIHQRIVQIGVREHVTQGRKLRSDGTVTETNIHYPTDSSLLTDSVRVLGRMLTAARRTVGRDRRVSPELFVNHTRSTKRLAREIARAVRKRQAVENTPKIQRRYRKLMRVAQETVAHIQTVVPILEGRPGHADRTLAKNMRHYLPLVRQVIDQAERRIVRHESVPAPEKLVSLFEPHTQVIRRGKPAPRETEFGRKLWLDEVDGGLCE